jgi:toxin ParE1/3/4
LADHPQLGPARPEIAPDARALVAGDYVGLYSVDGFKAVVVRVVHGARQLKDLFDLGADE